MNAPPPGPRTLAEHRYGPHTTPPPRARPQSPAQDADLGVEPGGLPRCWQGRRSYGRLASRMRAYSPPQVEGGSCPPAHTGDRHTKRDDQEHQRRPARDVLNADAEPPCALSRCGANGDVGVWQEDPGDLRNYARLLRGAREP